MTPDDDENSVDCLFIGVDLITGDYIFFFNDLFELHIETTVICFDPLRFLFPLFDLELIQFNWHILYKRVCMC